MHSVDSAFAVDGKIEGVRHMLDGLTVLRRATGSATLRDAENDTIAISQVSSPQLERETKCRRHSFISGAVCESHVTWWHSRSSARRGPTYGEILGRS